MKPIELSYFTCPICNDQLIPSKIECADLSGWMYGWLCDCNDNLREDISQVVVFTDKECADGLEILNNVLGNNDF